MKKERKEDSFLKKPWYKGGNEMLAKRINQLMHYPQEAIDLKIEGIVRTKIDIDHLGNVVDAKVEFGIGHGCDEEAIRLVKLLKFEVAKTPRKLKVIFHKNLNIHFKITESTIHKSNLDPIELPPNIPTNFTYDLVPSKKQVIESKPKKAPQTFNYTIKLN